MNSSNLSGSLSVAGLNQKRNSDLQIAVSALSRSKAITNGYTTITDPLDKLYTPPIIYSLRVLEDSIDNFPLFKVNQKKVKNYSLISFFLF
jgi:hypothetical protein